MNSAIVTDRSSLAGRLSIRRFRHVAPGRDLMEERMQASHLHRLLKHALYVPMAFGAIFGSIEKVAGQTLPLSGFKVDNTQTSVSGVSSGGYMAVRRRWFPRVLHPAFREGYCSRRLQVITREVERFLKPR
jgi:hypothetical protein